VTFLDKGAEYREWNATVIPVGKGSEGFDISPDGRELWTANAGDGTVSIIDIAGKKVVETLPANIRTANRLKFTPDGKLVFISMLNNSDVAVLDAATHKEVKRIPTGKGAAGIQMQPDGSHVFVSCTPDNYVAVIDPKTLAIVGRIDAGPHPDGLAWASQQ
jgi:YVTN family beta-propeller protein